MESDEAEQVARFRELSPAELAMLLSARKEPGKYTEGAVLGAHFQALVRIVPPPLALAHAMTEPEEKAERLRIMRHRHCTELEAAYAIAERLAEGGHEGAQWDLPWGLAGCEGERRRACDFRAPSIGFAIVDPTVIAKILKHLGMSARAPPRAPAQRFDRFQIA